MQAAGHNRALAGNRLDHLLSALIIGLPLLLATICCAMTFWLKPYEIHSSDPLADWFADNIATSSTTLLRQDPLVSFNSNAIGKSVQAVDSLFGAAKARFGDDPRFWLEWYRLRLLSLDYNSETHEQDKLAALQILQDVAGQAGDSGQAAVKRLFASTEARLAYDDLATNLKLDAYWDDPDFAAGLAEATQAPNQDSLSHMMLAGAWIAGGHFDEARAEVMAMPAADNTVLCSLVDTLRQQRLSQGDDPQGLGYPLLLLSNLSITQQGLISFIELKSPVEPLALAAWQRGDYEMLDALQCGIIAGMIPENAEMLDYLVCHTMLGRIHGVIRDNSQDSAELARIQDLFRRRKVHTSGIRSINSGRPSHPTDKLVLAYGAVENALSGGRQKLLKEGMQCDANYSYETAQLALLQADWDAFADYSFATAVFPDGWQSSDSDQQQALAEQQSRVGVDSQDLRQSALKLNLAVQRQVRSLLKEPAAARPRGEQGLEH